jgi:hypothetical protein
MFILTLLVITLLCLAFAPTRLIGVAGLALLFYLYPWVVTALLIVSGGGLFFFHHQNKENNS